MSAFSKASGSSSRNRAFSWGAKAVALVTTGLMLASCASGTSTASSSAAAKSVTPYTLKIGTSLPETGNLAFLGPPEEAGVALAVADINAANLPITVDVTYGDSGDTDNKAYETEVPRVLNAGVSAIIGAASSGVSKQFIDKVTAAGVILFSPANTSADFTTWDDKGLYWRTAPSDTLQGAVAGNLIAEDGNKTLGQIIINDSYGTGLANFTKTAFESAGGTVVAQEYYNVGDTSFDSQVSAVLAKNPDAIQIVAFDETKTIVPALISAGFSGSKLYFVDGNLADYSSTFKAGTLTGAKGTLPGLDTSTLGDFTTRLNDNWVKEGNTKLTDFSYAAESYDAVILTALASLAAGGSTDGATIASKLQEVSGGTGNGTKVTSFEEGAKAILAGQTIDYDGYSGPITFDEHGDPTEATIGIFQYQKDNTYVRIN